MAWLNLTSLLGQIRQPRSLRTLFLGLFLSQAIPAVGLIIWLTHQSRTETVQDLVKIVTAETSERVSTIIGQDLIAAQTINKINQDIVQTADRSNNIRGLINSCLIQLQNFPGIAAVGITQVGGYTFRLSRLATVKNEFQLEWLDANRPNELQISRINLKGQTLSQLPSLKPFALDDWAWYENYEKIGERAWSDPYVTRNDPSLVISNYDTQRNPQTQAIETIFVSTIEFRHLNRILEQQTFKANSLVIIVEPDGSLVGSSIAEKPYFFAPTQTGQPPTLQRRKLQDSSNPILVALQPFLSQAQNLQTGSNILFPIKVDGKTYYVEIEQLKENGSIDWLLVTVVSESQFSDVFGQKLIPTIAATAVLLIFLSGINLAVAQAVIHPIKKLQRNTKTLTYEPESGKSNLIPIKEVQDLDSAFREMTEKIQHTLNQFQITNVELEDQRAHLAQILDALPVGVGIHEADGQLSYMNPTGLKFLGLEKLPDFHGTPNLNQDFHLYQTGTDRLYPPEKLPAVQALQGQICEIDDIEVRHGEFKRILAARSTPLYNQAGTVEAALVAFLDITDRKHIQEILENYNATLSQEVAARTQALQKSEEKFRFALQSTVTSWWDWNVLTNEVDWSENFDEMVGRPPNSYPKNVESFLSFLHPDDVEPTRSQLMESLATDVPYKTEFRFVHPDGSIRWIMATGTVQRDENGQALRMSGINLDITERKETEEALKKSEQRLRMALESTSTHWWERDLKTGEANWSEAWETLLGYAPNTFEKNKDTFFHLLHPEDRDRVHDQIEATIRTGQSHQTEFRLRNADGTYLWLFETCNVEYDELGKPMRISGLNVNITPLKEIQLALAEREAMMQALFDQASQFTALLTPTGQVVKVNQRALDFADVTTAEILHQDFWHTPWWQYSDQAQTDLQSAINQASQGMMIRYDVENQGSHGQRVILDFSIRPIYDSDHRIIYLLCEGRDITDKFQIQQALQESEERFRQTFQTTAVSSALISLDGKFLEVNPAFCDLLGYGSTELIDRNVAEVTDADSVPFREDLTQQLLSREIMAYTQERRYQHRDGHWIWGLLNVSLVRDEQQQPLYYVCQIQNIDPLKQAQEKLQQVNSELERLTQIDGLTGVYNRRFFDQALEHEWQIAFRESESLALLMLDIDYFKLYNDTLGHQAGDHCLRIVAAVLQDSVHRTSDVVARYGGEEFALILPRTDLPGAIVIAERIQTLMARQAIPHPASEISPQVTVSIGIHSAIPRPGLPLRTWIKNADDALYQAKQRGRNRYVVLEEVLTAATKIEAELHLPED